jgi:hypothetical protein
LIALEIRFWSSWESWRASAGTVGRPFHSITGGGSRVALTLVAIAATSDCVSTGPVGCSERPARE